MMKSNTILFFLGVSLLFCINSFAQKCSYKDAEKKFNSKEYFAAIDLYKCAYKNLGSKQKPECVWRIAECYRLIGKYKDASLWYNKAIQAKCDQSETAKVYLSDSTMMQKDKNLIPKQQTKKQDPNVDY